MLPPELAIGFVHDGYIGDDPSPLRAFLDAPLQGSTVETHIQYYGKIVAATNRAPPPGKYRWKTVEKALLGGTLRYLDISTRQPPKPRADLVFSMQCQQPEVVDERNARSSPVIATRYTSEIILGASYLTNNEIVDALLAHCFRKVLVPLDMRAGVVVAATSSKDASTIAGASGGFLTPLQPRVSTLRSAKPAWGRLAREPEWGSFLRDEHVAAIGGVAAIERDVAPYRVLVEGHCVFVQLTPYDQALSADAEAKRAKLQALLMPVLALPLSRESPP